MRWQPVFGLLLALIVGSSPSNADSPRISETTLANGLHVIIAPDPSVSSVVVHVWYRVGSKDEVAGKTGFAHLFEHLMFEGSAHVKEGEFDSWLEAAGGWNNGTTNTERTNYYEQVPAAYLPLVLHLEADRMAGLWTAMNQKVLDNQRDVVKNELRQNYQNQPYGEAELSIPTWMWPKGHGNAHSTIGSMEDLTAASLADVEAFWRDYYVPANATLVIAGGVEATAALALVEKYFAWMPKREAPEVARLTAPVEPLAGPVTQTLTDDVSASKVIAAYRVSAPTDADAAAVQLLTQIIGGGKTSRLHKSLVKQRRLASEAYAYFDDQPLGSELRIEAIVSPGKTAAEVKAAIDSEVAALLGTAVSAGELTRAQRTYEVALVSSMENLATRAGMYAEWHARFGKADYLNATLASLRAVTSAQIRAAATKWLQPSAQLSVVIEPEKN